MPRFALIDACVLATFSVADLILRIAEDSTSWMPIWSSEILQEVERTHREKLAWPGHLADSFRQALESEFADSMVTGYSHLIPSLENEIKDRHVLAAAIEGKAEIIVTFNLRDFSRRVLEEWKLRAIHPQDYLRLIYEEDPARVEKCIDDIARARRGASNRDNYLTGLSRFVPEFVDGMRHE